MPRALLELKARRKAGVISSRVVRLTAPKWASGDAKQGGTAG
ncbi:hypothetical protein [Aerococcus urinae]|nr:hypothetical protein [Aerococcus urinae]